MSKMSLEWHRRCAENWSIRLEEDRKRIDSMLASYQRSLAQYQFYQIQIDHAEIEGKDSFDDERYKVKKGSR